MIKSFPIMRRTPPPGTRRLTRSMANHPRRRRHRRMTLLLPLLVLLAAFLWWSNTALQVTRFDPVFRRFPEGVDGCRIAVLSDLHGASFGGDNVALFAAVAEQEPDYIFYLGDL